VNLPVPPNPLPRSAGADRRLHRLLRRLCSGLESAQYLCHPAAERPHELTVIIIGDLAGPVVELELLQRGERTIAFLGERQQPLFRLVRPG
jgi:hypothetical protein